MKTADLNKKTIKHLSPLAAWAFALGTSIGWGSLVITTSDYLKRSGPIGSTIGLLISGLIMLLIGRNYAYMINRCPDQGGAYTYTKTVLGYDYGFLSAWFMILTYLSMLWANATSLPLFARYFFGNIFQYGYLYTIFGYDVYLSEALITFVAMLITAVICIGPSKFIDRLMSVLSLTFTFGIIICFIYAFTHLDNSLQPSYIPDGNKITQVFRIIAISPWAYIGFENISHQAEEFSFSKKRSTNLFRIIILSTTVLYIFITLLSASAYPSQYANWLAYIMDLGNQSGLNGLPAFYAANHYMGNIGIIILMISLFALIVTSLIGNTVTLSRLFAALAKDNIIPSSYGEVNRNGVNEKTILLIMMISSLIPLLGRTAVGWIVDVTILGAAIIYALVSITTFRLSRINRKKIESYTGIGGFVIMMFFVIYLLIPSRFTNSNIATESYFLFVIWALVGFVYYRYIIYKDKTRRFGSSTIVWAALLSLIMIVSMLWLIQTNMNNYMSSIDQILEHYHDVEDPYVMEILSSLELYNFDTVILVVIAIMIAIVVLLSVISTKVKETISYSDDVRHKSEVITKMQNGLIMVLADMVESRDQCTGDHVRKTAAYCRIILEQLRKDHKYEDILTDDYIEDVVNSAPLHDIGKIKVKDAILNKPGKLTPEEFEEIKKHTLAGNEIINQAIALVSDDSSYLKEAKNLATYHHEKYDGTGYPKGLKGNDIPLSARVMAVADVFDALVSKRSYKEPYPFDKAMDIIKEGSGKHFDPDIVTAFIEAKDEVKRIQESFMSVDQSLYRSQAENILNKIA